MFDGSAFPEPLDEEVFNNWLENGRNSKIKYNYLLIVWDAYESKYNPIYLHHRDDIEQFKPHNQPTLREALIAVYDLYSESRIV